MPLYKTITPNSQTCVKIWKISESYIDLMKPLALTKASLERVEDMKSEIHQRGFLSVRHLLREFGYQDADLYYDNFGKPHLKDGKHISITHSFNFSAVIVSDLIVGIDVEKQRDKITIIAHKFIDYENDYLNEGSPDYIRKLTILWCIKESLYKLFLTPGLSFKNHCFAIPFNIEDQETIAWIDYKNQKHRYNIQFLEFEGFSCAYAIA
ncbi:4'-phosphopantetheinyl transferase family protein [Seonamhaeicola aphaedonensis]|uniref:4'-phosphopantetheinyl transferase superfamily protein n=1 Tax=Seonamhaeicola aphaedonensis TaxID=1461338 RepID=A0A3D9HMJ2_9FLAO|nr:4'-phosphopantetheinyl transferase superfamily protein [Seonamhaeicola aphaedonensis]RED50625.1 4'-phosphopantetheinyl transferase superfamily protein [Seonamhaeicola aphaedonensis]